MTKNSLLIFDLDNTLIDTYESNYLAYKKAFEIENIKLDEGTYKKLYGYSFLDMIKNLNIDISSHTVENIKKNKSIFYKETIKKAKINNHLIALIDAFSDKAYIALATTASKQNAYMVLDYFKLTTKFDKILTAEDVEKNKPDPEIYNKIIGYYSIDIKHVSIYEDSDKGLEAGLKTGANVFKVCQF